MIKVTACVLLQCKYCLKVKQIMHCVNSNVGKQLNDRRSIENSQNNRHPYNQHVQIISVKLPVFLVVLLMMLHVYIVVVCLADLKTYAKFGKNEDKIR